MPILTSNTGATANYKWQQTDAKLPVYQKLNTKKLVEYHVHKDESISATEIFDYYGQMLVEIKLQGSTEAKTQYRARLFQFLRGYVYTELDEYDYHTPFDDEHLSYNYETTAAFPPSLRDSANLTIGDIITKKSNSGEWATARAEIELVGHPNYDSWHSMARFLPLQYASDRFVEQYGSHESEQVLVSRMQELLTPAQMLYEQQYLRGMRADRYVSNNTIDTDMAVATNQLTEARDRHDGLSGTIVLRAGLRYTKSGTTTWYCSTDKFGVAIITTEENSCANAYIMRQLVSPEGLRVTVRGGSIRPSLDGSRHMIKLNSWSIY